MRDHFSPWSSALDRLLSFDVCLLLVASAAARLPAFFWRLCHQLHHSPRRLEIVTSFYKHPVEIMLNSFLSSAIVYALLGCSVEAGAFYTLLTAVAEFFYHWNIRTPHWLGIPGAAPRVASCPPSIPASHQNFADLPIWDWLFGTFKNPRGSAGRCGFDAWREERFEDMLAFRDVQCGRCGKLTPLSLLPTCIGCSKRWACTSAREAR